MLNPLRDKNGGMHRSGSGGKSACYVAQGLSYEREGAGGGVAETVDGMGNNIKKGRSTASRHEGLKYEQQANLSTPTHVQRETHRVWSLEGLHCPVEERRNYCWRICTPFSIALLSHTMKQRQPRKGRRLKPRRRQVFTIIASRHHIGIVHGGSCYILFS